MLWLIHILHLHVTADIAFQSPIFQWVVLWKWQYFFITQPLSCFVFHLPNLLLTQNFVYPTFFSSVPTRAFFNYITGGAKAPPAPMVAPPLNHFGPPSQSPFSLKYKQNMEFRKEVWYSSNWNLHCESYVLSSIFNAKHCVVNTFNIIFYTFSSGLHIPDPIDLSCCKSRLNTL
jgi:hypothetical protein